MSDTLPTGARHLDEVALDKLGRVLEERVGLVGAPSGAQQDRGYRGDGDDHRGERDDPPDQPGIRNLAFLPAQAQTRGRRRAVKAASPNRRVDLEPPLSTWPQHWRVRAHAGRERTARRGSHQSARPAASAETEVQRTPRRAHAPARRTRPRRPAGPQQTDVEQPGHGEQGGEDRRAGRRPAARPARRPRARRPPEAPLPSCRRAACPSAEAGCAVSPPAPWQTGMPPIAPARRFAVPEAGCEAARGDAGRGAAEVDGAASAVARQEFAKDSGTCGRTSTVSAVARASPSTWGIASETGRTRAALGGCEHHPAGRRRRG